MKIIRCFWICAAGLVLLANESARAAYPSWLPNPMNGDWNTGANWSGGFAPNGANTAAIFGVSNITAISLSESVQVLKLTFDDPTSDYTFTIDSGLTLTLLDDGIVDSVDHPQTFVTQLSGAIAFTNSASAGIATFTNGGSITFAGSSNGGGANFTCGSRSAMVFHDNSNAETSTINALASTSSAEVGATIEFHDNSSLGAAKITVNGGTNGGRNASLYLYDDSISGASQVTLLGGGFVDMSFHAPTGAAFGSLSGDGTIFLGGNHLDIGFGEQGAPFTGRFADGGANGGTGGSITLAGGASLTLSDVDTYTGPTQVTDGTLTLAGSIRSDVTLQSFFSSLQGSGTIHGDLTNNIGQVLPAAEKAITVTGSYYQQTGLLSISIDGTGSGKTSELIVNGAVTLDTANLTINFTNGFLPHKGDTFTFMTFGSVTGSFNTPATITGVMPGFQYTIDQGVSSFTLTALNDGFQYTPTTVPLANISTRLGVETADNVLIGGFIVTNVPNISSGDGGTQKVLIRGIGPSLAASGVKGALQDPTLELHDSSGAIVSTNDNWKISSTGESQEAAIEATTIPPTNDAESAILTYLGTGAYTAILAGKNGSQGVGLIEVYALPLDVDSNPAQIANISTRGFVQTNDSVIIGGFIVAGDGGNANVLVRAIGPSLMNSNVANALADPTLELHDGNGAVIGSNDDWQSDQAEQIQETGIPPSNPKESAIYTSVGGGNYTAIVRGKNNTTGVGLIEVYRLP